jgi:hypothetical protein
VEDPATGSFCGFPIPPVTVERNRTEREESSSFLVCEAVYHPGFIVDQGFDPLLYEAKLALIILMASKLADPDVIPRQFEVGLGGRMGESIDVVHQLVVISLMLLSWNTIQKGKC